MLNRLRKRACSTWRNDQNRVSFVHYYYVYLYTLPDWLFGIYRKVLRVPEL